MPTTNLFSEQAQNEFTAALGYVMGDDVLPEEMLESIAEGVLTEFVTRLGGFLIDPAIQGVQASRLIANGRPAREIAFDGEEHPEPLIQWLDEAGDWHDVEEATA